jgi:urease accessory protein
MVGKPAPGKLIGFHAAAAMASSAPAVEPLVLRQRGLKGPMLADGPLVLALTAEERTRLRGQRQTRCGRKLLLQLPRGRALEPGEWLGATAEVPLVQVQAAPEALIQVRSPDPLALLQAAYHLGNRHVAMEIHCAELRLLDDPVLAHLLEHRGLQVGHLHAPFQPETGAYGHLSPHQHSPHSSHDH